MIFLAFYVAVAVVAWIVLVAVFEPDPIWGSGTTDKLMERAFFGFMAAFAVWFWPMILAVLAVRWWLRYTNFAGLWSRTHRDEASPSRERWRV